MPWKTFVGTVLLALATAGCSSTPAPGRIVVLGVDGMDPDAVDLLMSEGQLPNFARLRQEGAYGRLESRKPLLSPVVWTTIATGKTPDEHRIGHFVAVNAAGEQLPVTSRMRRAKALWNIFSDAGREVGVVGWWATWPAEAVRGSMVSDRTCYHFLFEEGITGGAEMQGKTHPPELAHEIAPLIRRPGALAPADVAPFVEVPAAEFARPFSFDDDLGHFKWALATAQSYERIGLHLLERDEPDLLMLYIEGTDSVAHLFGHLFRARGLSGELAEQQRRYGRAVEGMYRLADRMIGDLLDRLDSNTTLVVLSDHGFELGALQDDPSKTRDMRRVSEAFHRLHGILYLWGNGIKPRARLDGATILDVAPTLLTLAGLPAAADMPGRVLEEALTLAAAPRVATYETGGVELAEAAPADPAVDRAILDKLEALGYVSTSSPAGDRNLAAVLFESGRFAEAVEAYEKIVADDPDDGAAQASLAGALGALGRYDEALAHLSVAVKLSPLNPEVYHNRGVIYELRGDRDAAVREFTTALRYSPEYEPSRRALTRLGAGVSPQAPKDDAEQRAYRMAEAASQDARRGDYDAALAKLAEAQRIAPRYALLYQYRSNVAYLKGDRAAAIAALEQGLALEPDNALFTENLRRLREAPPR